MEQNLKFVVTLFKILVRISVTTSILVCFSAHSFVPLPHAVVDQNVC